MSTNITTLPVYSSLAHDSKVKRLGIWDKLPINPDGTRWHLSEHQVETYEALRCGDYDVVINSAMTGDGKSLAAQLPTLVDSRSLLMMYPTNELVRDQERQVAQALDQWKLAGKIRPTTMTGERLREIVAAGLFSRKAEVIRSLAANNDILLTNPDIFHYIAEFYYTRRDDAPDTLFGRAIVDQFDLFVFDEFHIFEAPQVAAALNAMMLIRAVTGQGQPKRFLFLSATPGGLLDEYLQKAGFHVKTIAPAADGLYLHTLDQPDETRWRPIIHASDINFWSVRAEEWADAHLDDVILAFFRTHGPAAKGAFIVNSVATAHRLVGKLRPAFERIGLTVLPNTGLTSAGIRKASREADLLIGTSTVDVGVDFRINLLIFESRDAGTFLQRLGRLGRHDDDGHGHRFERFTAHALIPAFVEERLFDGYQHDPALLCDGGQFTREQLGEAVRRAYPSPFEFGSYAQEWGWVQSAHVYVQLCNKTIKDGYVDVRERLKNDYWQAFQINLGPALRTYRALKAEAGLVVEEAQAFRGSSPFTCGIVDDSPLAQMQTLLGDSSEEALSGNVKKYDLLMLAANAEMTWLEPEEFARAARERRADLSGTEINELVGWFRLRDMATQRKEVRIVVNREVSVWGAEQWGEVQIIQGISLELPYAEWLNDLNRHLRQRKFVALLCLCEPQEMLKRLNLPPTFGLYPFVSRDGLTGSIAFARAALMLYVAIKERHIACGGGAIIC